jgi:stage II sporulation protein D
MKRLVLPLFVCLLAACAGGPAPASSPASAATASPAPAPTPAAAPPSIASPNRLTPAATIPKTIAEPRIRVGLLSDQSSVTFPRIDGGYYVISDAGPSILRRGFTVAAPVGEVPTPHYAVQVASISDFSSVESFTAKIRTESGQRVDALFDPSASNGGMYRILAGDFPDAKAAEPFRDDLVQRGYGKEMMIVRRPSDQPFDKKHQLVDDEGDAYTLDGATLLVMPVTADSVVIAGKPYRTAARLFINARGLFNVINELSLEDYLKGVVPAEMGPKVFDELEALKAQAIAARTYAVKNLGQFRREGYDICPGPACQAYLGFSGEDPLSSQAVTDTAGLILTQNGQPIDALYTATCGGETSDVGVMFPGRNEPYLKRVRCVEYEMTSIDGRADSGLLTEQQAGARIFAAIAGLPESGAAWSAREVEAAVAAAVRITGATPAATHPLSSRRGDILRYLGDVFALDANARALTLPEDRRYFFPQSGDAEARAYQIAAFLIKFGVMPTQELDRIDLEAAMPREELYALLGSWLRKHEALGETTGKIVSVSQRNLVLKAEGKNTTYTLPANTPLFRRLGDRLQEYKSLPVMIGDRAFLQRNARNAILAVIVQANYDGASFDRTSSFADWTRSYRADELVASINKRAPIRELQGLRALSVDASQRVVALEVTAESGRTFTLQGLPIRWSLNVPDNLFVIEKTKDPDGMDRYTFFGKGWGHGVGFCQVGAYGMAFRGWTYDRILQHYYTGVEIVKR